jgi:hypothetical protein
MAEPVKGILLVDLDGLSRGLAAAGGEVAESRFIERIDDWPSAVESGALAEPPDGACTVAVRRCYASAASTEEARAAFRRVGFDIIECEGPARVELCLAVDAMDAAVDATDGATFILLAAAEDLTPLVERLRSRGHRVAIYAGDDTAPAYREAADFIVSASALAAFLAKPVEPQATAAAAERGKIEPFAREIHAATSIPLLSPKTFAELFRLLAAEVAKNGYHFNDTAKRVAEQLNSAGRTVTARQVVFVVKGLALKGHVFSTNDTPQRLAEVFREQARYLIGGAGLTLDAGREALLAAWIAPPPVAPVGKIAARQARPAAAESKPKPSAPVALEKEPEPPSPPQVDKPTRKIVPVRRPQPSVAATPVKPRLPDRPKSTSLPARLPLPQPPKADSPPTDMRATIAARIAASAKMKPSTRPSQKPATVPVEPPPSVEPPRGGDELESSILAAIAQAVDVLVERGEPADSPRSRPSDPAATDKKSGEPAPDVPPPAEETEAPSDGDDIGDEIQRIVASYNRKRDEDGRG